MSSTSPFAILFVGFMIGVFILGIFAVLIRHMFYRTSGITADQTATLIPRGLDTAIINRLPTFLYSDVKYFKIVKGALECAICLNEFDDDETLRLLPICDHVFHPECIDAWLSSHTTCPVCRANLAETNTHELNPVFNISTVESDRESLTIGVAEEVVDDELIRSNSIKSMKWSKFPRSHSTGHSLVRPCENVDRFTLKLPDQIRRDIMTRGLNQTTSLTALARETSSRRGYRESYRRLGSLDRPDRWMVSMAPPFFSRESSVRKSNRSTSDSEGVNKGFNLVRKLSFNRFGGSKKSEPGLL